MKKAYHISIAKPGQNQTNEDCAIAQESLIAVSDGAGGGGVYADLWSAYLLNNLPQTPITSFSELNKWTEHIWEPFYVGCEEKAKIAGGMVLKKFYDEGSFATLAVVWKTNNLCRWISYGDSVIFHYNKEDDNLEHSFTKLVDFNNLPYLINCKDEPSEQGFGCGEFQINKNSIVFCATDSLSHYVLMMYELSHTERFQMELDEAQQTVSKNSLLISVASQNNIDFYNDVISKLINCRNHQYNFQKHIGALLRKNFIALDDFSYSIFEPLQ
ncbi:hypothetical protein [Parabacteroides sp. PF5-6]|uniref:hypothetical protein n=1 Tax=Parabacteroides sp. PF5-6 TaxID=1742403 RepID=UPI00240648CA|nr:hypothetical protein [Parabacteroides sp. PF5-6]MDF9829490.1 hypothetical protein [Parabacteroides sp. PF5-6]